MIFAFAHSSSNWLIHSMQTTRAREIKRMITISPKSDLPIRPSIIIFKMNVPLSASALFKITFIRNILTIKGLSYLAAYLIINAVLLINRLIEILSSLFLAIKRLSSFQHFFRQTFLIVLGLEREHFVIVFVECYQFFMCSAFNDFAVFH